MMNTRSCTGRCHFVRLLLSGLLVVFTSGSDAWAAVANVSVVNNSFRPASVSINVDDQVLWTWSGADGGTPHSTTSDSPGLWDSGIRTQPFQFAMNFPSQGRFPYHCTVHGGLGMVGTVTVRAAGGGGSGTAPTISAQPLSQTVSAGATVTFTVAATGSAPLSYGWRFNGTAIAGATRSSLLLRNVQARNAGTYTVLVSNAAGSTTSSDALLTVQTASNGNFVAGNYNGLFFEPAGVAQQSSGRFSLTTTARGKFSGFLQLGATRLPLAGQFDASGRTQNTIPRKGQNGLDVVLQLAPNDADIITGTVSDGTFNASLAGDRATFDGRQRLAPEAGRYTIIIPGSSDSATMPGGDGFGTLTVDRAGRISLSGFLADGTPVAQAVPVSKNGAWPLYVPLYGGRGSILGWIAFTPTATSDLEGDLVWIKPPAANAKLYPAGFTLSTRARGSAYQPGPGGAVLNISAGRVALSGGGLPDLIVNAITIGSRNRVTSLNSNKLVMAFAPATGLFSGRVIDPATSRLVSFKGAALQKENAARGWFLGTRQTGEVVVSGQ